MAVATGWSGQTLLGTAGHSPDVWAREIVLDLPNKSVMLGGGSGAALINAIEVPKGQVLSLPKLGGRTVSTRDRSTTAADNVDGGTPTYAALSDTAGTFTKRFSYNALALGYEALGDMGPAELSMSLQAHRDQMLMALANDIDAVTLALYSSATYDVGSPIGDFQIADLAEAIRRLEVANAPGPYKCVMPNTQWDHLAQTDELTRFDIRGESPVPNGTGFRYHGCDIFTTGNTTTASNIAHGLVFSPEAIRLVMREGVVVKDWDDPNTFSQKLAMYQDYAYVNTFTDWIVDFQTIDT